MRIDYEDSYRDDDMRVHCEGGPFTGEVVYRDAGGRMRALVSYVEGVPSGPQTKWYPDGSKKKEGQVRWGIAVGDWRRWHPNGQLAEHSFFSLQGRREHRRRWDKDGNLTEDRSFAS
ncbi:toxin-antitoxin system YwqK family antitoxin [Streptomyces angustmyceticus]|uniref:toxin-antitoxin system YwqK family antitoxin n=1 Tax=Streptomyces angustmyceticus TaxID=285578 RepID=UPI00369EECCF